jgi:hypothetical protein
MLSNSRPIRTGLNCISGPLKTTVPSSPSPRGAAGARTPYHELEKKAIAAEATLKEVQKEFDTYRKEKCENERMITEELNKSREELTATR